MVEPGYSAEDKTDAIKILLRHARQVEAAASAATASYSQRVQGGTKIAPQEAYMVSRVWLGRLKEFMPPKHYLYLLRNKVDKESATKIAQDEQARNVPLRAREISAYVDAATEELAHFINFEVRQKAKSRGNRQEFEAIVARRTLRARGISCPN